MMTERPECQIDGCQNKVLIAAYGILMCGECVIKINNKKNKEALSLLQND